MATYGGMGFAITVPDYVAPTDDTKSPTVDPTPSAADAAQAKYWADKGAAEKAAAEAAKNAAAAQTNRLIDITRDYFRANGMEAFINGMDKYIRAGYSGDDVMVMLKNDAEYKDAWNKRFAGNAERVKNGLSELLPATYIAMEQGYKQAMLKHQMPQTLFDDPNDFAALIANDVSAVEVNDRLQKASDYINYSGNAEVKKQLRELYGMTDAEMAAYVLDPKKTMTYLDSESRRNLNRANVGGAAVTQGVDLDKALRDEIGNYYDSVNSAYTSTYADSTTKFGSVAQESPAYQRLGALSSEVATADELVREQFNLTGAAGVTQKKKGLASQERARFSGQSGLGASSLSAGRAAQ